ncbi:helix-turn-helix transcriptional regulator [Lactobacillus sp. B4005]|uniref:helix-turn-helix transcriptional regulator n=1 Tax=Lactobacillus sp. B4005 TaxID=2818031 RepID=UPI00226A86A4|nr:helix-turn-helix transcriptional regulator [Lactobacillus sp. B4005]MCX8723086.1 transcriptional regulator [Lactobacillus sp. B4005]
MNRLKELRQKNNLTLKELSEQLSKRNIKISADALAKYERGDREPKIDKWNHLAEFYGVSLEYLMGLNSNSFGNRIKELRIKHGLSQSDLAKATGLTRQAISNYERGDREPKMEIWQKLADCFNVSIPSARGEIDTNKIQKILQTILFFNCSDDALGLLKTDEFAGCGREDKKHIAISYLMLLIFQELNIDPYNQFLLVVKKVANLLKLEGNERDNFIKQGMSTADMPNQKHDIKAANKLLNIYDEI